MLFEGGFTFSNFLIDVLTIFAFVVWFWLVITIFADLFRGPDISGWAKALWVLFVILTSYIGVIVYLITQGRGMTERNARQAQVARDELRRVVGSVSPTRSESLIGSGKAGSITESEFARLRARLVQ